MIRALCVRILLLITVDSFCSNKKYGIQMSDDKLFSSIVSFVLCKTTGKEDPFSSHGDYISGESETFPGHSKDHLRVGG